MLEIKKLNIRDGLESSLIYFKKFKNFILFKINIFLVFLNRFDVLMLKIFFKK